MFKLSNVENKIELSLSIEGYQFPETQNDDWCLVKVVVKQGKDFFETIDPALETTELLVILEWFKCLAEPKLPRYARLCFTEPCLEFAFLARKDDSVRIAIRLSHEMKPSFDLKQFGQLFSEWEVIFELKKNEFNKVISGVEAALQQYPIRGKS